MSMEVGQRIGRYLLKNRIGRGGMAEIFMAEELMADGSRRTVAVKRMFPRLSADREFVGMFVNEARIASSMGHPNIVQVFDMIETVDSEDLAQEIDKRSRESGKIMPVLIEVNSGREEQKFGVYPENVREFVEKISGLKSIKVMGLMTMGPFTGDPEDARPYFAETKKVFDQLKNIAIPGSEIKYLSMGMTNSYRVAIEEGANMVRIGTGIFGERFEV